jgi:hypothetical protein
VPSAGYGFAVGKATLRVPSAGYGFAVGKATLRVPSAGYGFAVGKATLRVPSAGYGFAVGKATLRVPSAGYGFAVGKATLRVPSAGYGFAVSKYNLTRSTLDATFIMLNAFRKCSLLTFTNGIRSSIGGGHSSSPLAKPIGHSAYNLPLCILNNPSSTITFP